MTKIVDIRAKSGDELNGMLLDLRKEQFNLRFQRATGQLEALGRIKAVRRDIARVKTLMAERARAASSNKAGRRPRQCRSESSRAGSSATRWTRRSPSWSSVA
jgi:large subunit ribosomal protein L29